MTVCIAAIAAETKAIVLVADKAASYVLDNRTTLKADVAVRKIRRMNALGWVALISGPMDFGERVIDLADSTYAVQEGPVMMGVPECMKMAYQVCRRIEAVDRILIPRMLTREWYDKKVAGAISQEDQFFIAIADEIGTFSNSSTIMLCGFENGTPEIYLISNPGVLGSGSPEGFAAVGIGQETALNRLYALETDPNDGLEKVLYDAFDAKEACSESLPDVGREWDAMVMVEGKETVEVDEEISKLIGQLYDSYPKSPFAKPDDPEPDGWRQKLGAWTKAILANAA
jgi:hypothetical protein